MTQKFSKLNKIGSSFKQAKLGQKPNFTIGRSTKNETSSESDEDYDESIFQPNVSVVTGKPLGYSPGILPNYVIHKFIWLWSFLGIDQNRSIEQGLEVTEDSSVEDDYLPAVGIVMGQKNETNTAVEGVLENKQNLLSRVDSSQMDDVQLSRIMQSISGMQPTPEIQIEGEIADAKKVSCYNCVIISDDY